jgi:DNA-binding MarR family transcriptional regulator
MKNRVLDELEDAGCPGFQYGVLALLLEGPALTQGRIADALGIDPSQLVGELDKLEANRFIVRQRDPADRRRHTVAITPKGEKELVKLRAAVRRIEDEYLAPLDARARKQLHELLLRVAQGNDPRFRR